MIESEELTSPNRRALFRRLVKPKPVELPQSKYPRPPWAQENAVFLALCDRCEECIKVCPQRVLRTSDEANPVLSGRPVLSLDYGSCDFCGECANRCPTGALNKELGQKVQAIATVEGHCQLALKQPCDFCIDACEANALTIVDNKIEINSKLCNGCGECSLDCYNKAIVIKKR